MTKSILILLLAVCPFVGSGAEPPDKSQAETAVAEFSRAMYSQHWGEAAAWMHPDALEQFHQMFVHIAKTPKDAKDQQEAFRMFGVSSVGELEAIKPDVFFAKLFSILFPMFQKSTQQMWAGTKVDIIGSVVERDDLIHVVIRTRCEVQSAPVSVVSVDSVQRVGSEWKVLLNAEMQAMLTKLKN